MNAARFLEVGDLLASSIDRFLKATTPKARAVRTYAPTVSDLSTAGYVADAINFRVFVLPDFPKWESTTRAHQQCDYTFNVLFFEKCQDQTVPPSNAWVDRRVLLTDKVREEFANPKNAVLREELSGLRYVDPGVSQSPYTVFADQDELREEGCFWCEMSLTYREYIRA